MTLITIPASEPMHVENINVLLYGTPGIGKTSIAASASEPLLLDFDRGAYRSAFRCEVMPVENWQQVVGFKPKDLERFNTIILDTVGRSLDHLTRSIQEENPKYRTPNGGLTLQGWGELKSGYAGWLRGLRLMGKDVILVAHDKEEKRNDLTVTRADIQGGSYAEIFKLADSVAWFGPGGEHGHGILDFDPTAEHNGKNPGQMPKIEVPNLIQQPNFMADVIKQIKGKLGEVSERGRYIVAAVDLHRVDIEAAKSLKAINELASASNQIEDRAVQGQVKHLILARATYLGMQYDKVKKQFIKPKGEAQDEPKDEVAA